MKLGLTHVERIRDNGEVPPGGFLTKVELRFPMPEEVRNAIGTRQVQMNGIPNMEWDALYTLKAELVAADGTNVPFVAYSVWREIVR